MVQKITMSEKLEEEAKARAKFFEEALLQCKFGKFHIRLLLASLASICAFSMVTTTSSYLLPNADCDLNMNLMQKGLLTAGPYFGAFAIAMFGSFLLDTFGRRPFLVGGHATMFVFSVLEASSQSYWNMLLMKVLEGVTLILCSISMLAIIAEFTHKNLRDRFVMFIMSFSPLALIGNALISWALLPHQNWHFIIWKGHFELHSWNIYLYVCSVFSLISAVLYYTIPESPKYLYYQRKEHEAIEVLKSVYSENTGCDRETYPVKTLGSLGSLSSVRMTAKQRMQAYLIMLQRLSRKPHVYQMLLYSSVSFMCQLVNSTIRLWYPQMSSILENFRMEHGDTDRFCVMINQYTEQLQHNMVNSTGPGVCVPTPSGPETYINMIVISLITFFSLNVSAYLVNFVGKKLLMFLLCLLSAVAFAQLYWTTSSQQIALMVAIISAFLHATVGLQKTAFSSIFPTTLRALGLSVVILSSRSGALLGNVLFPVMLQVDCMVPFLVFAVAMICTSGLIYFIPIPKKVT